MKVNEKSLELNIGAEFLNILRSSVGYPKAYLQGLTQWEEKNVGVDFFARLPGTFRIYAFQFKAPKRDPENYKEKLPYRFELKREQHELLYRLARSNLESVYYVFPFYFSSDKFIKKIPDLIQDTWCLRVGDLKTTKTFKWNKTTQDDEKSKTIRCYNYRAEINPSYEMIRFSDLALSLGGLTEPPLRGRGIEPNEFAEWYADLPRYESTSNVTSRFKIRRMVVEGLWIMIYSPGR